LHRAAAARKPQPNTDQGGQGGQRRNHPPALQGFAGTSCPGVAARPPCPSSQNRGRRGGAPHARSLRWVTSP
jgi:hypothetical protein